MLIFGNFVNVLMLVEGFLDTIIELVHGIGVAMQVNAISFATSLNGEIQGGLI